MTKGHWQCKKHRKNEQRDCDSCLSAWGMNVIKMNKERMKLVEWVKE